MTAKKNAKQPTADNTPAAVIMEHQAYAAMTKPVDMGASTVSSITHLYAPYLIGISFVAMTGLLTLLLTVVMDNKAELEQVTARQTAEPILADARMAFGLENSSPKSMTAQAEQPALLSDEAAVSPAAKPFTSAENQTPATAEAINEQSQPATEPAMEKNELAAATAEADNTTIPEATTDKVVAALTNATDTSPAITAQTSTIADQNLMAENISTQQSQPAPLKTEIAATGQDLDRVISDHDRQINEIRTVILERSYQNRQNIEQTITNQLRLMEMQVRTIEEDLRPAYPSAIASYERIIIRRRASFQRMMRNRERLLQRIHKNHKRLQERYSQLLRMLDREIPGIV